MYTALPAPQVDGVVDEMLSRLEQDESGAVTLEAWRDACRRDPDIAACLDTGLLLEEAVAEAGPR